MSYMLSDRLISPRRERPQTGLLQSLFLLFLKNTFSWISPVKVVKVSFRIPRQAPASARIRRLKLFRRSSARFGSSKESFRYSSSITACRKATAFFKIPKRRLLHGGRLRCSTSPQKRGSDSGLLENDEDISKLEKFSARKLERSKKM